MSDLDYFDPWALEDLDERRDAVARNVYQMHVGRVLVVSMLHIEDWRGLARLWYAERQPVRVRVIETPDAEVIRRYRDKRREDVMARWRVELVDADPRLADYGDCTFTLDAGTTQGLEWRRGSWLYEAEPSEAERMEQERRARTEASHAAATTADEPADFGWSDDDHLPF